MTTKDISTLRTRVEQLIISRRIREAFATLSDSCRRHMAWEIGDRLEKAEKAYVYMLSYVAQGIDDPERETVYSGIVTDLYARLDDLVRFLEKNESPTLYYNYLRTNSLPGKRINISIALQQLENHPSDVLRRNVFTAVWITHPFSDQDEGALLSALTSDSLDTGLKVMIISALMLGMQKFYDPRRMGVIIRVYMAAGNAKVKAAALVALLLGLWRHRNRPLDTRTANILAAAKDCKEWNSDLRTAFLEIIRTRNTERINRKMIDEVIPRMIDLRPDIMKKIRDGKINPDDLSSVQENPEWQEMLDKSGITDRLKELTEMQQEGGDVFMSTFSHLKNFPFFSEISNWFLPFSSDLPEVQSAAKSYGSIADALENAFYLCDSDKFSFIFALGALPEQQREMMSAQLNAQTDAMAEMKNQMQDATAPDVFRQVLNAYVQNIYRFFRLYSRKEEFSDPFAENINLIAVPALADDFTETGMLQMVAEFYFKSGFYTDALEVFGKLDEILPGDAQQYQKMGYCEEKTGDRESAIDYYRRAELIDGQNLWTRRRLAATLRAAGYMDEALKRYAALCADYPDNLNLALQYGYILTEKGRYAEALNQFYKVEYLDENSDRAWRPLAWTLFLTGDFEGAQKYYEKVLGSNPTAGDYLNMGHTAAALGNLREAINNYSLSLQTSGGDRTKFLDDLKADSETLIKAGISAQTIALLADTVFYSLDK